jgi:hypothetical protein
VSHADELECDWEYLHLNTKVVKFVVLMAMSICDAMLAGNWLSEDMVSHHGRQYSSLITKYRKTILTY